MQFRSKLLALLSVVACASASLVFHEARAAPPKGFVSRGTTSEDQTIELRIGLASTNIDGLHDKLMSVSTPGSAEFRQWLSADDVKSFVQPTSESVAAFNAFAKVNNLQTRNISPNGEWVAVSTTVGKANALFGAQYEDFEHEALAKPLVRTLSVSLPSELVGHVEVLHPSTSFESPNMRLTPLPKSALVEKRDVPASCNSTITPACLQELYGIPTTPATEKSNTLLVTSYQSQWVQQVDIQEFLTQFRPDMPSTTSYTVQYVDGGLDPQEVYDAGIEADLDMEYTMGLATGVPVTFLTSENFDLTSAMIDTAAVIGNYSKPPSVVTTSYAGDEDGFSESLAIKLCNMYMSLGARGISILYASGDGGVRGGHDSTSQCSLTTFIPVFPSSCPYVTAVGATIGVQPEIAMNLTGGGFSNYFAAPSYQKTAVAQFKESLPSNFGGYFNETGRGYPDVSTQGWNFNIVVAGKTNLIGGTSAASPTFASVIALINDRLVAAGKPVLGFLNPWIYSSASSAFTDVTEGKNVGYTCPNSAISFTATEGWDPLTGFGTPVFSKLLAAAMA
ncbi:hypothetical protein PHLGIDRAFT_79697 [Phlebiopsis gigantea 11061_1 CR5-6]|uniref:tripeptidyl-peptidase II n=1 Tax=Phlebiopsis gigantea (strain 11061_1 CR5-6) TaxID=745531 RepID=A0A0C3RQF7_PHLG1|nr:hypothetical protein PHLGIDRAFT_79697 [Phlebiopsis gigantea 11061_1 CR5-6]